MQGLWSAVNIMMTIAHELGKDDTSVQTKTKCWNRLRHDYRLPSGDMSLHPLCPIHRAVGTIVICACLLCTVTHRRTHMKLCEHHLLFVAKELDHSTSSAENSANSCSKSKRIAIVVPPHSLTNATNVGVARKPGSCRVANSALPILVVQLLERWVSAAHWLASITSYNTRSRPV